MNLGEELQLFFYPCMFHFVVPPYRAGSHTACGRQQPLHTAAETTGRERTEASVGWAAVQEPELSHSPICPRCNVKYLTKGMIQIDIFHHSYYTQVHWILTNNI